MMSTESHMFPCENRVESHEANARGGTGSRLERFVRGCSSPNLQRSRRQPRREDGAGRCGRVAPLVPPPVAANGRGCGSDWSRRTE